MAYFDSVKPPKPPIGEKTIGQIATFAEFVKNVEQRALEVVNEKYPYMIDMINKNCPIIIDPYANYSPEDSKYWQELFIITQDEPDLYARLFFIRGGGTKLIKNEQWGFFMQPVVGHNGWNSIEQYDIEKQCLIKYAAEIIRLLKNMAKTKLPDWEERDNHG